MERFSPSKWIPANFFQPEPTVMKCPMYTAIAYIEGVPWTLVLRWADSYEGSKPGWLLRGSVLYAPKPDQKVFLATTVEGRKGSRIETLHKNVRKALAARPFARQS